MSMEGLKESITRHTARVQSTHIYTPHTVYAYMMRLIQLETFQKTDSSKNKRIRKLLIQCSVQAFFDDCLYSFR